MDELVYPDPPLADGVVVLRAWGPDDAAFVVGAMQDERVWRYSPSLPVPYVEADAVAWFATHEPVQASGHGIEFAVAAAGSGALLGAIGVKDVDSEQGTAEVGYWLAQQARGFGYMSRAVRLICRWAFDDLGLGRVQLTADPANVESQRVAERCGFQQEGLLRSNLVVRHSGERRDSVVFGLLPGELG